MKNCEECDGTGTVDVSTGGSTEVWNGWEPDTKVQTCGTCEGTGQVEKVCAFCGQPGELVLETDNEWYHNSSTDCK